MRNFATENKIISFRPKGNRDLAAQQDEREYISILRVFDQSRRKAHQLGNVRERYLLAAFQEEIDRSETIVQA